MQNCMNDVASWWLPIMDKYVDKIEGISRPHVKEALIEEAGGIPKPLCSAIHRVWEAECNKLMSELRKIFTNRLEKEIPWGTVNYYLTSKFKGDEALPKALADDFLNSLTSETIRPMMKKDNWLDLLKNSSLRYLGLFPKSLV